MRGGPWRSGAVDQHEERLCEIAATHDLGGSGSGAAAETVTS